MVWGRLGQCYWTQRSLIRGRVWQGLMEEKGSQDVSPGWGGSLTKHWLFITAWLTQCVCKVRCLFVDVCACVQSRESEKMCVHLYCKLCVCAHNSMCMCFLPHCSGIPVEKVVWSERAALTVWVFMDLAPMGWFGLHCSQTKPLQQDPDTYSHRKGSNRRRGTQEMGRQGNKRENGELVGGSIVRSVQWLPFFQECRCDRLWCTTGPTLSSSAFNQNDVICCDHYLLSHRVRTCPILQYYRDAL